MENFETAMETQQRRMTLKIDFFILLLPLIFDLAKRNIKIKQVWRMVLVIGKTGWLARIFWLIFQLSRQLAILGRQLDFRGSISPLTIIKILTIRSTSVWFWILTPCSSISWAGTFARQLTFCLGIVLFYSAILKFKQ